MASFNLNITGGSSPYTISVKAQGDNTERFMSYSGGIVTFMYASGIHNYDIVVSKAGCTSATQSFTLNCDVPVPTPIPVPNCTPISGVTIIGTDSPKATTSVTYNISYVGSTLSSGTWSVSGGASITYQETSYCDIVFPSAGSYTILYNYTSCGNNYSVSKVVNATPCTAISNLSIFGNTSFNENQEAGFVAQYDGNSSDISSYYWTISGGNGAYIVTGQTSEVMIVQLTNQGLTVNLTVVSCGQTFTSSKTITVVSAPVPVPNPVPVPVNPPTPIPTPIPVPVEVPTPVTPPTPIPTPVPVPIPTPTGIIVPECAVLLNSNSNVYYYDYQNNIITQVPSGYGSSSPDIAHTANKMWLYNGSVISEFNITLNTWTYSFNRNITLSFNLGAGLSASSDTKLLTTKTVSAVTSVYEIDISGGSPIETFLFNISSSRIIAGDLLKTTDDKIIMTTTNGSQTFISQYNMLGNLEFEKELGLSNPYGIFIDSGEIYINNYSDVYHLQKTSPYNLTLSKSISPTTNVSGASQIASCCNTSITPLTPSVVVIQPDCSTGTTGKVTINNVYNGYKWRACNSSTFICSNDCSSFDGVVSGNSLTFDSGYINGFGFQYYTIRIWSTDTTCETYKDYTVIFAESLC